MVLFSDLNWRGRRAGDPAPQNFNCREMVQFKCRSTEFAKINARQIKRSQHSARQAKTQTNRISHNSRSRTANKI